MSSTLVNLRVGVGFISKKLVGSFGVDGLGWCLGLGVNGDVRKVQVREQSLNLTEGIIKVVDEGATKLLQKSVRVTILPYHILLSLMEQTFCFHDLSLLILEYFLQRLNLHL